MTPRPFADPLPTERLDDPSRAPFDLKVLVLYGLARFRKPIVALAALGTVAGIFLGAAQPNVYSINAKLRFVPSMRQALTEEAAFGVEIREFRGRMTSAIEEELELLKDPVIFERVVDQIGAAEILRVADPRSGDGADTPLIKRAMHSLQAGLIRLKGQGAPVDAPDAPWARAAAAGKLAAATTVKAVGRTNIIDVVYADSSPAKAKTIGDEIVRQMRARHLEEFQARTQLEVLKETKNNAYQEMRRARLEAYEFKNQCGFFDLENDFQACQEQIRANTLLEQRLEQDRERLLGQIKALENELGLRTSGETVDGEEQKQLNPKWVALSSDINELNEDILAEEVKPNPGIISIRRKENLEERRDKLLEELDRTPQFGAGSGLQVLTADANEALVNTQTLLSTAKGDLEGVISQIGVVREQLKDQEQRRRTMEECRVEHIRLENAVKSAEAKYQDLTDNELQLTSLAIMDEEDRSNLTLFRPARMPSIKTGPDRKKPLVMGLFGGVALGLGFAVLRQLLERRVRYRETVEQQLGMPVLCTVPDLGAGPAAPAKGVA